MLNTRSRDPTVGGWVSTERAVELEKMSIRTGSLTRELLAEDPELVALLLEDYQDAKRREHCSRADFAAGWLALAKRMKLSETLRARRREMLEQVA